MWHSLPIQPRRIWRSPWRVNARSNLAARRQFDRALALAPGNARVQSNFARFASFVGRREAAETAARRAGDSIRKTTSRI